MSEIAPEVARAEEAAYREAFDLYFRRLLETLGPDGLLERLRGLHRHLVSVSTTTGGKTTWIVTTFEFGVDDAAAARFVEAAGGQVTQGAPS